MYVLLTNLGQIGNSVFFVASIWFFLESRHIKSTKAVKMIIETFIASIICLGAVEVFGYHVPIKEVIFSFLPLTYGFYWFISCYLLIYLIHPFLNRMISEITQYQHFVFAFFLFALYCIIVVALGGDLYYYNELLGFLTLYLITSYYKSYIYKKICTEDGRKIIYKFLYVSIICWGISSLALAFLSEYVGAFANKLLWLNRFVNPCFVVMGVSLVSISSCKQFYSKLINYLSSLSLIVFLLHNNKLIRTIVEVDYYNRFADWFGSYNFLVAIITYFIISVSLSFIIGSLLKKIFESSLIEKLSSRINNIITSLIEKVYSLTQ